MRTTTTIITTGTITIRRTTTTETGGTIPLRDPAAITAASFAIIEREAGLERLPPGLRPVAARIVHACGMVEVAGDLAWRGEPWTRVRQALLSGAPVLVDSRMVAAGITRRRLPAGNAVLCTLDDAAVPDLAAALGTTRSAAAVERWRPHLAGAVVAFGNAPTALFHLLERLSLWPVRPAAILAFPVGFVGAAESKAALLESDVGVPCLTLPGRRGGSAMAAAAVNALASAEI
jgi:precorrin-8X/cobalt-precorrin-8 methylmutase